MSLNEPGRRGRKPIGERAMTAAERKRRSREAARARVNLQSGDAKIIQEMAAKMGLSDRSIRYYIEVCDGVPEWQEYYRRHGKDNEYLSVKRAAIAVRYLDEDQQRQFLETLENRGLGFTTALYSEMFRHGEGRRSRLRFNS